MRQAVNTSWAVPRQFGIVNGAQPQPLPAGAHARLHPGQPASEAGALGGLHGRAAAVRANGVSEHEPDPARTSAVRAPHLGGRRPHRRSEPFNASRTPGPGRAISRTGPSLPGDGAGGHAIVGWHAGAGAGSVKDTERRSGLKADSPRQERQVITVARQLSKQPPWVPHLVDAARCRRATGLPSERPRAGRNGPWAGCGQSASEPEFASALDCQPPVSRSEGH